MVMSSISPLQGKIHGFFSGILEATDINDANEDVTILDSNVIENLMETAKFVLNITDDDENKNLDSTGRNVFFYLILEPLNALFPAAKRKKSFKNDFFTKKTKVGIQQSKVLCIFIYSSLSIKNLFASIFSLNQRRTQCRLSKL